MLAHVLCVLRFTALEVLLSDACSDVFDHVLRVLRFTALGDEEGERREEEG